MAAAKPDVQVIFNEVITRDSDESRVKYLDDVCANHPDLRARVEALLSAHSEAGGFLGGQPATTAIQPITEKPGTRIGPYKLREQIGEGGFGTVYVAEQEKPVARRVALKVIKSGMDTQTVVARFEAERQALAMMDHENIARVLDAGTSKSGAPYFVMELVQGIPLTEYCDRHKLSIEDRLKLFATICRAVQHAHQKGIIHRDLKPSNVLVCLYDGRPAPKVIDFGLAKALEHQTRLTDRTIFTEIGQVVGTLRYMSPEQAEMNQFDVDTRTDIYSLGVMLYELLTGSTPIDDDSVRRKAVLQVLESIRNDEPIRPSARLSTASHKVVSGVTEQRQIDPGRLQSILRGELDWIVMKALEKDRTRRYETANAFAEDVEHFLSGEVVEARPPSARYRLQKYARRHKGLVASVVAITAALVVGIVASTWFALAAREAREVADREAQTAGFQEERARAAQKLSDSKTTETLTANAAMQTALADAEKSLARSHYFLARARWEDIRVAEARNLLHQIPVKHRGFVWHFDRRKFDGGYLTLYGHEMRVADAEFSPDGQWVASSDEDGVIRIWDVATGRPLRRIVAHKGAIRITFSHDGQRLASAGEDKLIRLWDVQTGEKRGELSGHTRDVFALSFNSDGRRLASAGGDRVVRLWETDTSSLLHEYRGHTQGVVGVAFTPDDSILVSQGWSGRYKLWDVTTGAEQDSFVVETDGGALHEDKDGSTQEFAVNAFAMSPDGQRLAIAGGAQTVRLCDTKSGAIVASLQSHSDVVCSLAFSPDGARLVTASRNGELKLWHVGTGTEQATFRGHCGLITGVAFNRNGSHLVSSSADGTIKLWDLRRTGEETLTCTGHRNFLKSIDFSPDGKFIASGSRDQTVRIWDPTTGQELRSLSFPGKVKTVAFSPKGSLLAAAGESGHVKLWEPETGKELKSFRANHEYWAGAEFSPDGVVLAVTCGPTMTLWNVASGKPLRRHNEPDLYLGKPTYSGDGQLIAYVAHYDEQRKSLVRIRDVRTGAVAHTLDTFSGRVNAVALDSQRDILATAHDETVTLWNLTTLEKERTFTALGTVYNLEFHPSGRVLATAEWGMSARDSGIGIWDIETGEELRRLKGHSEVWDVAFSPKGTRLASAGGPANTIKLWDATPRDDRRILAGHSGIVEALAFSADNTQLHSRDENDVNLTWDVASGKIVADNHGDATLSPQALRSHDDRWLALATGRDIELVDLALQDTPEESEFLRGRYRVDPSWHESKAKFAEDSREWFAAMYHRACALSADPKRKDRYHLFHASYQRWKEVYESRHQRVEAGNDVSTRPSDKLLSTIVRDVLPLSPGDKFPVLSERRRVQIQIRYMGWSHSRRKRTEGQINAHDVDFIRSVTAQEIHPESKQWHYLTLGLAQMRAGHFEDAINTCKQTLSSGVTSERVEDAISLAVIALSYKALGQDQQALEFRRKFEEVVNSMPIQESNHWKTLPKEVEAAFK